MSRLAIRTNHKWREFRAYEELPRAQMERFDYAKDSLFFCYRRHWYALTDFIRDGAPEGWHGIAADSFSNGVLIELSPDGERFRVGVYAVRGGESC